LPKYYFEDFTPGQTIEHGPRLITREEIVAFAAQFDPQPMHLDEDSGRNSLLGGLGASGWHSCGIMMRMIYDAFLQDAASMGAGGVDEVQWLRPIRPGDKLTLRGKVLESRPSRSRPEMGILHVRYELYNGHGEHVMTMLTPQMLYRRNSGVPS
jgi:acyl dehydratase